MKTDQVELFGGSQIQHGPANDRVYLMSLEQDDFPRIIAYLHGLAVLHDYSKIFVKVPESVQDGFEKESYHKEAKVPRFYNGKTGAVFMARYFRTDRACDPAAERVQQVLETANGRAGQSPSGPLPAGCTLRLAGPEDAGQMASLYRQVFASYPFAIDDPGYLRETMADNLIYAGIWKGETLLALASAEVDRKGSNAELTDFATDPDWRGSGLADHLLRRLEAEMAGMGIGCCYTIARATSFGMNIVFARQGYHYGGTLINNTQISGGLESMNVWYRHLPVVE